MINLVLDKDSKYKKQIAYTFYYLCRNYNDKISVSYAHKNEAVNLYYGIKPQNKAGILIPEIIPKTDKVTFFKNCNNDVFLSFEDFKGNPFEVNDDNVVFKFDILSTSFYLLSCKEEYEIPTRDNMNRFLAQFSLRYRYVDRAFFDINSVILYEAIKSIYPQLVYKTKSFEILLTHDVDSLNSRDRYVFLHNAKELMLNRDKRKFSYRLSNFTLDLVKNRHLQIKNCISIEKRREAVSEFYFIQGLKHRLGKRYEMEDIKSEIDFIKNSSDCVIGLHTNYFSYENTEAIRDEIDAIESGARVKVESGRNHYLRFSIPNTWQALSSSGIKCDCTLGYSDINGFRAATSNQFIPYDIIKDETINICEVPLIIMDSLAMEKNKGFEEKWNDIKNIIDNVVRFRGTASILWHERLIYDKDYKAMYERILDYIKNNNGKFILSSEIIRRSELERRELQKIFNALV